VTLRFNLIDDPFIPCVMIDGSCVQLGLRQTLARAGHIREIRDRSPLVTVSLHRLLLAILHRNFGPRNQEEWSARWQGCRFDQETLDHYFELFYDRFDLFDGDTPFYQTAGMTTARPHPIAKLFQDLASNNNPTLFDHTMNAAGHAISSRAAAKGLIACQSFDLRGGAGTTVTVKGVSMHTGYLQDGPLTRGLLVLLRGDNLFETLMLNLSGYKSSPDDLPIWERDDPEAIVRQSHIDGRVDLYTFQCRRLRLETDKQSGRVTCVHFAQGRAVPPDTLDPMKSYRRDKKRGWIPLATDEHRALWRDSGTLLEFVHQADSEGKGGVPAQALHWVGRLVNKGVLPQHRHFNLDVFAIVTSGKAARVILWRHERLPLPLEYLSDPNLVGNLRTALGAAEEVADRLRSAVRFYAAAVLAPEPGQKPDAERVRALVGALAPERLYWSRLETPFRRFLIELPGDEAHRSGELTQWVRILDRTARQAFDNAVEQTETSARAMRAAVQARSMLIGGLSGTLKPFKETSNALAASG